MFVAASIGCVGLVFVDMGVFETSGYFAGIIYFLLLLGAVFKIIAAGKLSRYRIFDRSTVFNEVKTDLQNHKFLVFSDFSILLFRGVRLL